MTDAREPDGDVFQRLQQFVGRPATATVTSRDPVNLPMVRHWCDALGDRNPVYVDPQAAAVSRHGDLVAPPAMLETWCMDRASAGGLVGDVSAFMDAAGFPAVVATDYEQDYLRPLRIGDRLTEERTVEAVSPLKRTALGDGHFITLRGSFHDQAGALVGTTRMRILRYRPVEKAAGTRPRPPVNRDTEFFWAGVERGELLAQRCAGCAALRHPPSPSCPRCGSFAWTAERISGRGRVHSWVVHHHPPLPGFALPVVVVLADMEEGTRFVADLVGVAPADVREGLPVEVEFARHDDQVLPRFRRAT